MYPIRLQAAEYFEVPEVVCEDPADQDDNRHGWCCEMLMRVNTITSSDSRQTKCFALSCVGGGQEL